MVCHSCQRSIGIAPEIRIDGRSHCFTCAKTKWNQTWKIRECEDSCKAQSRIFWVLCVILLFIFPPGALIGIFLIWAKRDTDLKTIDKHTLRGGQRNRFIAYGPKTEIMPVKYSLLKGVTFSRFSLADECNDFEMIDVGYNRHEIFERDGMMCQTCGEIYEADQLEAHHVMPRKASGSDSYRNLVTLCVSCHMDEDWFGHYHQNNNSKRNVRSYL